MDYLEFLQKPIVCQPNHVFQIYQYLKSRGYDFYLYKELSCSKYVLAMNCSTRYYKNAKEFVDEFFPLFVEERNKERQEILHKQIERENNNRRLENIIWNVK